MTTRGRKAGDAFETDIKLAKRYDMEEQLGTISRLLNWINQCLKDDNAFKPCGNTEWKTVALFLKDGTVICRLLNRIRHEFNLPPVSFKKTPKVAFHSMGNIEAFNLGAEEFGVPTTCLFQTADLVDGRKGPLINVINCLNQLGFVANASGFNPKYEAIHPPKADY